MNRTGKSLFDAVCADPSDDALQLVFADWLEEEGNDPDRAEAIRMQVRRRALDDLDPEAWVLDTRLKRMCAAHDEESKAACLELDGASVGGWPLATTAHADSPQDLLKYQDTIFAAGPVSHLGVGVVTLKGNNPIPDAAELLTRCKYLDRLRSMQITGVALPVSFGIDVLARCPGLSKLNSLDLSQNVLEDDFLDHLARCPTWPSLQELNLYRNSFDRPGMRALAGSPLLSSLRSLNLDSCSTRAGARELLRSPYLAGLRSLNLCENDLDSRVVKILSDYPWQCLERLVLSDNELTAAAVRHLANSERLATLRSLNLAGNFDVSDDGVKALVRSPYLGALCDLDLSCNRMTVAGFRALGRAPWLGQIRRLRLAGFEAGVAGLKTLADAPLSGLRYLDVSFCYGDFTDEYVPVLLGAPWISQLTHLRLEENRIGVAGAKALAGSTALENIVELAVFNSDLTDDAVAVLRERFGERVVLEGGE